MTVLHPLLEEFRQQAVKVTDQRDTLNWHRQYSEALARMIVEESIKVIDRNYVLFGNPNYDNWADALRDHFGIERKP